MSSVQRVVIMIIAVHKKWNSKEYRKRMVFGVVIDEIECSKKISGPMRR